MERLAKSIRTASFTRRANRLLSDLEIAALEESVTSRPDAHPVVPGTGGVRKARWARPGKGKRGGLRAVYYFQVSADLVYMLDIYAKNEKPDLNGADKRELRRIAAELERF